MRATVPWRRYDRGCHSACATHLSFTAIFDLSIYRRRNRRSNAEQILAEAIRPLRCEQMPTMNEMPGAAAVTRENPPINPDHPGSRPSPCLGPRSKAQESDFLVWGAGFYSVGPILNEHPPRELYDFQLQKRICEDGPFSNRRIRTIFHTHLLNPDRSGINALSNMTAYGRIKALRWPESILGPPPSLREVNLACWGSFLLCLILPLSLLLFSRWKAGPIGDFVYFYGDGRLANEYPPTLLYDYGLQLKIFNEIDPTRGNLYGPSPYPPFVALFFGLIAHFPYRFAYVVWFGVSLALYVIGVWAIAREVYPEDWLKSSLALCFALSFPPFLINTLVSGQISSLAVFSIGIAIGSEFRSRPFWTGVALSILTYKPTLLLVILPMLFLRRKIVSILGFVAGTLLLFLTTTAVDGVQIWPPYVRFLLFFGRISRIPGTLKRWQFIDLYSFSCNLLRGEFQIAFLIFTGISTVVAVWMATLFWKAAPETRSTQSLVWSNALTWTLLFNVYVPIYDSTLAIIGLILTIGELGRRPSMGWMIFLATLISALSWKSESIAQRYGVQPLTVMFLILGLWQLTLLHRAIHRGSERSIELLGA
jgi:hypothetical protein